MSFQEQTEEKNEKKKLTEQEFNIMYATEYKKIISRIEKEKKSNFLFYAK